MAEIIWLQVFPRKLNHKDVKQRVFGRQSDGSEFINASEAYASAWKCKVECGFRDNGTDISIFFVVDRLPTGDKHFRAGTREEFDYETQRLQSNQGGLLPYTNFGKWNQCRHQRDQQSALQTYQRQPSYQPPAPYQQTLPMMAHGAISDGVPSTLSASAAGFTPGPNCNFGQQAPPSSGVPIPTAPAAERTSGQRAIPIRCVPVPTAPAADRASRQPIIPAVRAPVLRAPAVERNQNSVQVPQSRNPESPTAPNPIVDRLRESSPRTRSSRSNPPLSASSSHHETHIKGYSSDGDSSSVSKVRPNAGRRPLQLPAEEVFPETSASRNRLSPIRNGNNRREVEPFPPFPNAGSPTTRQIQQTLEDGEAHRSFHPSLDTERDSLPRMDEPLPNSQSEIDQPGVTDFTNTLRQQHRTLGNGLFLRNDIWTETPGRHFATGNIYSPQPRRSNLWHSDEKMANSQADRQLLREIDELYANSTLLGMSTPEPRASEPTRIGSGGFGAIGDGRPSPQHPFLSPEVHRQMLSEFRNWRPAPALQQTGKHPREYIYAVPSS